jgi:toxin ParE1/3/4
MNYRFHPAAEAEHLEQIVFYESRQQGLGSRYRTHFLRTIERICEAPAQYAVEQPPDIRRARLRLFPLTVLYREQSGVIQILAVAHFRRRPGYWSARVRTSGMG